MLRPSLSSVLKSFSHVNRFFGRKIPKIDRGRVEKEPETDNNTQQQNIETDFDIEFAQSEIQNHRIQTIREMQQRVEAVSELAIRDSTKVEQPKEIVPEPAKTFFKKLNVFSKAQTEHLIKNENIYIDGKPADLSTKIEPNSKITLKISKNEFDDLFANTRLYMLNKPIGFVGDEVDRMGKGRRTVIEVIHQIYKHDEKLYPIVD